MVAWLGLAGCSRNKDDHDSCDSNRWNSEVESIGTYTLMMPDDLLSDTEIVMVAWIRGPGGDLRLARVSSWAGRRWLQAWAPDDLAPAMLDAHKNRVRAAVPTFDIADVEDNQRRDLARWRDAQIATGGAP